MSQAVRAFFIVALAAMFAVFLPSLHGATFVVPPDETLIDSSTAIVFGVVVAAEPKFNGAGEIETTFTIQIDEVLKGSFEENRVSLVEWGGRIGDEAMVASGGPHYEVGKSYLIFMTADRNGEWTTQHFALGRFERKGDLFVRDVTEVHGWDIRGNAAAEIDRRVEPFREFIRQRVTGIKSTAASYFIDARPEIARATADDIAPNFAEYDLEDASDIGAASWANDSGSDVEYSIGADTSDTALDLNTGADKIIEEDPHDLIPGVWTGSGVVAQARWRTSGSHPFDGDTLGTITGSNVITQKGIKASSIGQSKFRTTMVHELGHTLGFRHSNESCTTEVPCTSSAVMNSSVATLNGVLQTWDINAVRAVYGTVGGASNYVSGRRVDTDIGFKLAKDVCFPATIATQPPAATNITLGETTQSTVVAGGSVPASYQWYSGTSPDTDVPIPGATTNKLNVTPQSAGTYHIWVRVTNACGSADSNTAAITATCANPAITAGPSGVTITQGQSTQLQVTATGSSLSFQWYKGESGDTSNALGTNSNKLTVSPNETTKYWVRVSGACGSPVNSAAATVTVNACANITVNAPTATQLPGIGNFSISVVATSSSGPLTYTWFRGGTPGFGGTSLGPGQTKTVNVTTATNFWARVQNGCGRVEFSSLLTLASCTLPTITTEPSDQTINSGQTASLSIAFSAGATVKWYRGLIGDKTAEVGSAADLNVGPLTETTQFWAEVTKPGCGSIVSRQVTVTVRELTELVPMLNGRFFVQVRYVNQFDNNKEGKLLGRSLFNSPISDTAIFTFGDPLVVELMVRLSDARPFEDKIHLFLGGLSDVEFSIVVTDSLTGIIREYGKPANQLVGAIDRTSFPGGISLQSGLDSLRAQTVRNIVPTAESSTIRLLNNRFEVRMRYRNQFTNPPGEGYMNARSIASSSTTETAVFFFDQNVGSVEWMVRFSDARPFANRIDMFHGGLSDVEFTVEVHDTQTGVHKEYHKNPFSLNGQVDRDSYLP